MMVNYYEVENDNRSTFQFTSITGRDGKMKKVFLDL